VKTRGGESRLSWYCFEGVEGEKRFLLMTKAIRRALKKTTRISLRRGGYLGKGRWKWKKSPRVIPQGKMLARGRSSFIGREKSRKEDLWVDDEKAAELIGRGYRTGKK